MTTTAAAPRRIPPPGRLPGRHAPGHDTRPNALAAAILRMLRDADVPYVPVRPGTAGPADSSAPYVLGAHLPGAVSHEQCPVVVCRHAPAASPAGPVLVALDDDANTDPLVGYAVGEADRLRVPLRVVHVCTEATTTAQRRWTTRQDRMPDADRLLACALYRHATGAEVPVERQILHDREPAAALAELSRSAAMLVVAATSGAVADAPLGETTAALLGRTACPLVVLPTRPTEDEP
jgi:nucleotide-binding universal stress UspA family protein